MEAKDLMWGAIAVGILIVLGKLFGRDAGEQLSDAEETQNAIDAFKFNDMREIFDPRAAHTAMMAGIVPSTVFAALHNNGGTTRIAKAVRLLKEAPGAINDTEGKTVFAFAALSNYPELLMFVETFAIELSGVPPGPFVLDFMSPADDTAYMAAIVRHIQRLRAPYHVT
jgi:hypothetical protein